MKTFRNTLTVTTILALSTSGCAESESDAEGENPFFTESSLLLKLPDFDKIQDHDFAPAFERGMAEQRAEIEAIANQTASPTLENTLVAMERSGEVLQRVAAVFFNLV